MDVYRQAAEIVELVRKGTGTAKALCLRKEMQKKKQTYAVVCETLRHYELLQDVLEAAEFFKYYPRASRSLAMVMAYDQVVGKGVNTSNDTTARAIQESSAYLREAYWRVEKHHTIPPRVFDKLPDEDQEDNGNKAESSRSKMVIPRYARINTLKISKEVLLERLERAKNANKRPRDEDGEQRKPRKVLPKFSEDPVIPNLLVFPSGTDLHAHPAVRSGQLILQDRASCLPAAVLLDAVACKLSFAEEARNPLEYIIDACAAPGNKTTHVAALGAEGNVKIMALERDERRAKLLEQRVFSLGASEMVNVVNMDFFDLASSDREATEAILLDPSCSASGVVTRVDVALMYERRKSSGTSSSPADVGETAEDGEAAAIDAADQENNFSSNEERVTKLARLQRKLLAHALLSFDNCRTVVYSTCSVHEEENEGVIREVLRDERVQARGWSLTNIMPKQWKTRGIRQVEDAFPLDFTIRCDPAKDATNGFYVARLDRPTPAVKNSGSNNHKTK
eukprot:gene8251-5772_t